MPIKGARAHAFLPTAGMPSSLTLVLRWAHLKDRSPLLILYTTTFASRVVNHHGVFVSAHLHAAESRIQIAD